MYAKIVNLKKEVGITIKSKETMQVASHAAQPVGNTELCNYNALACNCWLKRM